MMQVPMYLYERIREEVRRAAVRIVPFTRRKDFSLTLTHPDRAAHGDYATSIALQLAKVFKRPPLKIAQELSGILGKQQGLFERVEAVPPGFVNIFLAPRSLEAATREILLLDENYGNMRVGKRRKVQVEFISANPTGPLTIGNGRGGFFGDALSNILEAAGYRVTREYYVNDAGTQVEKLGWSLLAAAFKEQGISRSLPVNAEELYRGSYVSRYAEKIQKDYQPKLEDEELHYLARAFAKEGMKLALSEIKRAVKKLGIRFDSWFSEQSLHRRGRIDKTLKELKRKKLIEKYQGAVWLRAQELGESKDRVLMRSTGEPTYLLPDLAYHEDKFQRRKFSWVIDIVGADHHGHMQALSAGLRALGFPEPTVVLTQLVRLVSRGKEVRMSKRRGEFVTLEDLVGEVGLDAARFFFLQRSPSAHMDFDLDLAKEQSEKNPVYYVQYAHARISSILRKASEQDSKEARQQGSEKARNRDSAIARSPRSLALLAHESELALMKQLVRLPELIEHIARTLEVHQLTTYAMDLARSFHAFYRDCKVISDDQKLTQARLALCRATQITLRNTLALMGIRAPERM